ncbi:MAG: radical SAM protein [Candidatus Cloacimonetes bacterium]|nr:radical SAM protein [Candidatus Cloacimonadota bacterium]
MSFVKSNLDLAGVLQQKVFEGPRHVVIDLTNRCNTNCIACWTYSPLLQKQNRPDKSWYKETLQLDNLLYLIEDLHEMGVERIRFTGGGEPLLFKDVDRLISEIKARDIWLAITTNGILLNDERISLLRSLKVDEIAISLWAATGETYKKIHPKSKAEEFWKIMSAMERLKTGEWSPSVHMLNVINRLNVHEIEKMADLARNLRFDSVYFTLVDAMDDTKSLLLNDQDRINALRQIQRVKARYSSQEEIQLDNFKGFEDRLNDVSNDQEYDRNKLDSLPCTMGWHFARITADGFVAPCCKGVEYKMGNINVDRFKKIWVNHKYQVFRNLAYNEKKDHPYFEKMACYQMCDNLMHIEEIQRRLDQVNPGEKESLLQYNGPEIS